MQKSFLVLIVLICASMAEASGRGMPRKAQLVHTDSYEEMIGKYLAENSDLLLVQSQRKRKASAALDMPPPAQVAKVDEPEAALSTLSKQLDRADQIFEKIAIEDQTSQERYECILDADVLQLRKPTTHSVEHLEGFAALLAQGWRFANPKRFGKMATAIKEPDRYVEAAKILCSWADQAQLGDAIRGDLLTSLQGLEQASTQRAYHEGIAPSVKRTSISAYDSSRRRVGLNIMRLYTKIVDIIASEIERLAQERKLSIEQLRATAQQCPSLSSQLSSSQASHYSGDTIVVDVQS